MFFGFFYSYYKPKILIFFVYLYFLIIKFNLNFKLVLSLVGINLIPCFGLKKDCFFSIKRGQSIVFKNSDLGSGSILFDLYMETNSPLIVLGFFSFLILSPKEKEKEISLFFYLLKKHGFKKEFLSCLRYNNYFVNTRFLKGLSKKPVGFLFPFFKKNKNPIFSSDSIFSTVVFNMKKYGDWGDFNKFKVNYHFKNNGVFLELSRPDSVGYKKKIPIGYLSLFFERLFEIMLKNTKKQYFLFSEYLSESDVLFFIHVFLRLRLKNNYVLEFICFEDFFYGLNLFSGGFVVTFVWSFDRKVDKKSFLNKLYLKIV